MSEGALNIYRDEDYPHGMRCGNEDCDFLFAEGDEIHSLPLAMFDDGTPVEMVICSACAVGVGDKG